MLDDVTWEFALRRGVRFHDGAAFTAADVVASLRRAPDVRNSPASFVLYTRAIESVTVVDAHTLRIRTIGPWPLLAHDLAAVAIVPRSAAAAGTADFNSGRAMIGTGPFRFHSWVPGEEVALEGNPEWWGGPVPWRHDEPKKKLRRTIAQDCDSVFGASGFFLRASASSKPIRAF